MTEDNGQLTTFKVENEETPLGRSARVSLINGIGDEFVSAYEEVPSFLPGFSQLCIVEDGEKTVGVINSPLTGSSEDTERFYNVVNVLNEQFSLGVPITETNKRHLHVRDLANGVVYSNGKNGIEMRVNTGLEREGNELYKKAFDLSFFGRALIGGCSIGGTVGLVGGVALGVATQDTTELVHGSVIGTFVGALCGACCVMKLSDSNLLRKISVRKVEQPEFMLGRFYKTNSRLSHVRSEDVSKRELKNYEGIVSSARERYEQLAELKGLMLDEQGISVSYQAKEREKVIESFGRIRDGLERRLVA